jgi:hypothetical protein
MKELGRLEVAVRAAEERRAQYASKRTDRVQEATRKKMEIAAEAERVGAGGEPDKKLEQRLLRELRELESGLAVRAENYPLPGGVPDVRAELYDEAAEAAWRGADEAVRKAQTDLEAFAAENLSRLAVELGPQAADIKTRADAWLREGNRLAGEDQAMAGLFVRLLVLAGREELNGTLPPSVFEVLRDAPREATPPMPECFWPTTEPAR